MQLHREGCSDEVAVAQGGVQQRSDMGAVAQGGVQRRSDMGAAAQGGCSDGVMGAGQILIDFSCYCSAVGGVIRCLGPGWPLFLD